MMHRKTTHVVYKNGPFLLRSQEVVAIQPCSHALYENVFILGLGMSLCSNYYMLLGFHGPCSQTAQDCRINEMFSCNLLATFFGGTCHQANVGLIAWEHFMNALPRDSIKVSDYLHFWSVTNGNG